MVSVQPTDVRPSAASSASQASAPPPAACHLWKAATLSPCAKTSSSACRRACFGFEASALTWGGREGAAGGQGQA